MANRSSFVHEASALELPIRPRHKDVNVGGCAPRSAIVMAPWLPRNPAEKDWVSPRTENRRLWLQPVMPGMADQAWRHTGEFLALWRWPERPDRVQAVVRAQEDAADCDGGSSSGPQCRCLCPSQLFGSHSTIILYSCMLNHNVLDYIALHYSRANYNILYLLNHIIMYYTIAHHLPLGLTGGAGRKGWNFLPVVGKTSAGNRASFCPSDCSADEDEGELRRLQEPRAEREDRRLNLCVTETGRRCHRVPADWSNSWTAAAVRHTFWRASRGRSQPVFAGCWVVIGCEFIMEWNWAHPVDNHKASRLILDDHPNVSKWC